MKTARPVLFLLLHIPLAFVMETSRALATVHALLTLAIGLYFAFSRKPERILYVLAYIAGAEILWRMNRADIFWEYGKYASSIIMLCYIVLSKKSLQPVAGRFIAIMYFALMLPSVLITFEESMNAMGDISFNLSGPLSLMFSVLTLSRIKITPGTIEKISLSLIAPVLAIATIASHNTFMSADALVFGEQSMLITSGGFGPNQVSAILGLGALFCIAFFALSRKRMVKAFAAIMFFWLLIQTFLTFSRGGIYNLFFAMFIGVYPLLTNRKTRLSIAVLVVILVVFLQFAVFPFLDSFTDGAFYTRFENVDTTSRKMIAEADLQIWLDNPIMGVGAGISIHHRRNILGKVVAAHTEFTRMLAEHGIFGLASILFLFIMAFHSYRRADSPLAKGLILMCFSWAMLEMSHAAMRIYAISFMFGLSQANYVIAPLVVSLDRKKTASSFSRITIEPAEKTRFHIQDNRQTVIYPNRRNS